MHAHHMHAADLYVHVVMLHVGVQSMAMGTRVYRSAYGSDASIRFGDSRCDALEMQCSYEMAHAAMGIDHSHMRSDVVLDMLLYMSTL